MTVAASKTSDYDSLSGSAGIERRYATVRNAREILIGRGLRESRGLDDEGFYFVSEDAPEFGICYNDLGRGETGLLECCRVLAQRGFTLSLFLSARTSALYVRNDR